MRPVLARPEAFDWECPPRLQGCRGQPRGATRNRFACRLILFPCSLSSLLCRWAGKLCLACWFGGQIRNSPGPETTFR